MNDLKIGSKLYGYTYERHGWTNRIPRRHDFKITRETSKMWVLTLGHREFQKIFKKDLKVHGEGISVVLEKDKKIEKSILEWKEFLLVKEYAENFIKYANDNTGKIEEKYKKFAEFVKAQ